MAGSASRALTLSNLSLCKRLFINYRHFPSPKLFSSFSHPKRNTKVNFPLFDSESESEPEKNTISRETKLPTPYDPFNKKSMIEEPNDPTDLQQVFHKIRTQGLTNNFVKLFDRLSKDGLTHKALELFGQIKDKGIMPDMVAHTDVIESYSIAGQAKQALKAYLLMLVSGVTPNADTYVVFIKGLVGYKDVKHVVEAKKYMVEMTGKGMQPSAGTCVIVFEAFVREGKMEEGSALVKAFKIQGFAPQEKAVREVLREHGTRSHIHTILLGK